jgi:hypothetical protein
MNVGASDADTEPEAEFAVLAPKSFPTPTFEPTNRDW